MAKKLSNLKREDFEIFPSWQTHFICENGKFFYKNPPLRFPSALANYEWGIYYNAYDKFFKQKELEVLLPKFKIDKYAHEQAILKLCQFFVLYWDYYKYFYENYKYKNSKNYSIKLHLEYAHEETIKILFESS